MAGRTGETGVQVADGSSEDRPIAKAQGPARVKRHHLLAGVVFKESGDSKSEQKESVDGILLGRLGC